MRTKNTLKNALYAVVSYMFLFLMAFVIRRVFIQNLPVSLLGYEGLFGNLFALFSLADLGIDTIILYRLFPAFANKDEIEIRRLMAIYRKWYYKVGISIAGLGVLAIPFLHFIVSGNNLDWSYVYYIYIIQLSATVFTYFLAYNRILLVVSMREYECVKIETLFVALFNVCKLIVLIFFKSYMLYLFAGMISGVCSNYFISRKVKKTFPGLIPIGFGQFKHQKLDLEDSFKKEIRDNVIQKISGVIYGGTDSIVISALLGINSVGLYANYLLVQGYVTGFFTKIIKPFQASIGNYIHTNERGQETDGLFRMFDMVSFFGAGLVSSCYLVMFNPFITLWLGEAYLLDQVFVLALATNQYVQWNHQFITIYRSGFGHYEIDRNPVICAAVINIIVSIILGKIIGIAGVIIGTIIGHMGFWFGRARTVYKLYMCETIRNYIFRQIKRLFLWAGEMCLSFFICQKLPISIMGIVLRLLICCMITFGINMLFTFRSVEARMAYKYFVTIKNNIKEKE
jgi:hypothetical protein